METEQSVKPKEIRSSLVFNCSLKNGFSSFLSQNFVMSKIMIGLCFTRFLSLIFFKVKQDHDWCIDDFVKFVMIYL